jgi:hypothetical protein
MDSNESGKLRTSELTVSTATFAANSIGYPKIPVEIAGKATFLNPAFSATDRLFL